MEDTEQQREGVDQGKKKLLTLKGKTTPRRGQLEKEEEIKGKEKVGKGSLERIRAEEEEER